MPFNKAHLYFARTDLIASCGRRHIAVLRLPDAVGGQINLIRRQRHATGRHRGLLVLITGDDAS